MDFFTMYMVFAVATAITSIYELFQPVVKLQEANGVVENKWLMYTAFFLINILIAPIVFLSCIVPSMGVRFRIALQEGLFPKE